MVHSNFEGLNGSVGNRIGRFLALCGLVLVTSALGLSSCGGGGEVPWDPSLLDTAVQDVPETDCIDCDVWGPACEEDSDCAELAEKYGQCWEISCDQSVGKCFADKFALDGTACDDGAFCTVGETCLAGKCQGAEPNACDDELACTVDECDATNSVCTHEGDDALCTEGSECSTGTCDLTQGCVYTGDDTKCDDEIDCTADHCTAGVGCEHQADDTLCDNGLFCDGVEMCDPETGCQEGETVIDDGVDCTTDECDEDADEVTHIADDTACNDGDFCNGEETCDLTDGCVAGTAPQVPATDPTCDGVDDDCDGTVDDDYVPVVACGDGLCGITSTPSTCVAGVETACVPGTPAADDTLCNGIDDDCNGSIDEDYVVDDTCGVGVCKSNNTPSSCVDGMETACQPGTAAANDVTCDGLDEDCDGSVDEEYVVDDTCGVGLCLATNTPSSCVNGVETLCQAGTAAANDITCDHVDDDCDGTADEDAVPACDYGEPVVGIEVVFHSTQGLPTGIVIDNGDGTYVSDIVDVSNPNVEGEVTASANTTVSRPTNFTVANGVPSSLKLAISRTTLYKDDASFKAYAYARDEIGAPLGAGQNVLFTMTANATQYPGTTQYEGNGIYSATFTAPAAAFTTTTSGTVRATLGSLTSNTAGFDAIASTAMASLAVGQVGLQLPLGARLDGTQFAVPVYVNTGTNTVGSYNFAVHFDETVLQVLSVDKGTATVLADPTDNAQAGANTTGVLLFNAINTDPTLVGATQAKGSMVNVAVIQFQVKAGVASGLTALVSGEVNQLLNTSGSGVSFSTSNTIQIGGPTGVAASGLVQAKNRTTQGVFTRLEDNTLVDFYLLHGAHPTTDLVVTAVRSDAVLLDISNDTTTNIVSATPAVATVGSPLITAAGAGTSAITATANGFSDASTVHVLEPVLPMDAFVLDPSLDWIDGMERYQESQMEVRATFEDGALFSFILDVTDEVEYSTTTPTIVAVEDGTGRVTALADGAGVIEVKGVPGTLLGTAAVAVASTTHVSASHIMVLIPANVELDDPNPTDPEDGVAQTEVNAMVTSLFTAEEQTAQTTALLVFSDDALTDGGSRLDISGDANISYESTDNTVGTVDAAGIVTAVGGGQASVNATLEDGTGTVIATGTGNFSVALPDVVNVVVSVVDNRLALSDVDVAHTLLGLPTTRQLQVIVHYADNTTKDFTNDPRTVYDAVSADPEDRIGVLNPADCDGVPGCNPGEVNATGNGFGEATVEVSFPGTYLEGFPRSKVMEVVTHQDIRVESYELYTPAGLTPVAEHLLSYIEGTGIWQRSRLQVINYFTDGSTLDITAHAGTQYAIYAPGTTTPNTAVLQVTAEHLSVALGVGSVDVVASNSGHDTLPLGMAVDGNDEDIAQMHLAYDSGTTVQAIQGSVAGNFDVYCTFADGTHNWLTDGELIAGLLRFDSSDAAGATVSAAGAVTAMGNVQVIFSVDVAAAMDTGVAFNPAVVQSLPVNLLPAVGDVDMGDTTGLAFKDKVVDTMFTVPVRVNAGTSSLAGIDIEIYYDPAVLQFDDLSVAGTPLQSGVSSFSVFTPGVIRFNGTTVPGNEPTGVVTVANVSFLALKGGDAISEMGGVIRGFKAVGDVNIGGAVPRNFIAGAGLLDPPVGGVWGDANNSEIFDVYDIAFIQRYLAAMETPTADQLAQSDTFPDGDIKVNDAYYLSRILSGRSAFVDPVLTQDAAHPGEWDLDIYLFNDAGAPETNAQVMLEFGTTLNAGTITFSDVHIPTASGVLTTAQAAGPGHFTTHISGLFALETIGIVVLVDILDSAMVVQETTAFIETPYFDPLSTFIPLLVLDVTEVCFPTDATCDGVDDDCDGTADDDYVVDDTCGVGLCLTTNTPSSCVGGVETLCQAGTGAATDTDCNGVDDDCNGSADDGYVSISGCGVGYCAMNEVPSSCVGGVETGCVAGSPLSNDDATCDGVDDNCNGSNDEDYVVDDTCGVGLCHTTNVPSSCVGGIETPCASGVAAPDDQTCDHIDDDCNGTADEDAVPACDYAAPVVGAEVVFQTDLGMVTGIVTDNGDGTYDTNLVDATNPNLSGTVGATVNGYPTPAASSAFSVSSGVPAVIDVVVARSQLTGDSRTETVYARVTDDLSAPVANATSVVFRFNNNGTITPVNGTAMGNGIFRATWVAPQASFTAGGTVSVTATAGAITTTPENFTLVASPAAFVSAAGQVWSQLPLGPVFDNQQFTIPLFANTGTYNVGSYQVAMVYDAAVLEVVDVVQGAATDMNPPVWSDDGLGNLSFNSTNANPSANSVSGPAVEIARVVFRSIASVPAGTIASITGSVDKLNNTVGVGVNFNTDGVIHILDADGEGLTGFVRIANRVIMGLFLSIEDNALMDFFDVDGSVTSTLATVTAVLSSGALADVTGDAVITSQDLGVAVVVADEVTAQGRGQVALEATADGFSATTEMWVLTVEVPADVRISDALLANITPWNVFQSGEMEVRGTFTDGALFSFIIDITDRVVFASQAAGVAAVDAAGLVTGVSDGTTSIEARSDTGAVLGSAEVTVDGATNVTMDSILVVVPAWVEILSVLANPILDEDGMAAVQAMVKALFTFEGQQVPGAAYLVFSDDADTDGGSRLEVTNHANIRYASDNAGVASVDANGLVTAVGGGKANITATLDDGAGNDLATGSAEVTVNLPAPVALYATVADKRLARDEMDSAAILLGLPVSRQITVMVEFADGSMRDYTNDPRAVYDDVTLDPDNLLDAQDVISCAGDPMCHPGETFSTGAMYGTAYVNVRFSDSYLGALAPVAVEFEVVAHQDIQLNSYELYTPSGDRVEEHELAFIEGTGVWQRGQMSVVNRFTDGSTLDVTLDPSVTFYVYDAGTINPQPGIVDIDGVSRIVSALGPGAVDIVAGINGNTSGILAMSVVAMEEDIVTLHMSHAGDTFLGIKDVGQTSLFVYCTYNDGTRNILTGTELIPGLLAFDADKPEFATVDGTGTATARGNGMEIFTVTVDPMVDVSPAIAAPGALEIPVNLLPDVGDVDLGNYSGLAFPILSGDQYWDMGVRVNTGAARLGGFDFEIVYDPTVVEAVSATIGSGIPGAIFTGNVVNPGIIYMNGSPDVGGAPVVGTGVEVGVIRFHALPGKTPGVPVITPIAGTIKSIIDFDGVTIGLPTPKAIVAGAGDLDPDSDGLYGDANDDSAFDPGDILFIQKSLVGLEVPNPTQLAQSDLFADGEVQINDAYYGSRVMAYASHFVEGGATADTTIPKDVILDVVVVNAAQAPVLTGINIWFEVATVNNLATITFTNAGVATASGIKTLAVGDGTGHYSTHVSGLDISEAGVGVAVILEVLDQANNPAYTTAFIESPELDPAGTFRPYFTFDVGNCAATDGTCNNVDDDCDGVIDDEACHVGGLCYDNGSACDDGLAYTLNDICVNGLCAGVAENCCDHVAFGDVAVLNSMLVAGAGVGLDLDGNGSIDNGLSALDATINSIITNYGMAYVLAQGSLLADMGSFVAPSVEFPLGFFLGVLDPDNTGCDFQAQTCDFVVGSDNFTGQCLTKYAMNATVDAGVLTAREASGAVTISGWYEGTTIEATVYDLTLSATVVGAPGAVTGFANGILGGALAPATFHTLVDQIPDASIPSGYTKSMFHTWVDSLPLDYDQDGDGTVDTISFAMAFNAGDGRVTGCADTCLVNSDCDDANVCTVDVCNSLAGCTHGNVANGTPCDDGDAMTFGDQCVSGECIGAPMATGCCSDASLADLTTRDALVMSDVALSDAGGVGQVLSAGSVTAINSLLSGTVVNVASGIGSLLFDFANAGAGSFELPTYFAGLDPTQGACDFTNTLCDFVVGEDNFAAGTCGPRYSLAAQITGNVLHGETASFDVVAWYEGVLMSFSLEDVVLDGTLSGVPGAYTGFAGTLSARVSVQDANALIDLIPESYLDEIATTLGLPAGNATFIREALKGVIDGLDDGSGTIVALFNLTLGDAAISGCGTYCVSDAECDDGFACTTDHCDSLTGCWYEASDAACDDSNVCTTETCEIGSGCVVVNVANGTACDDSDAMTYDDTCLNGVCVGAPKGTGCCASATFGDVVALSGLTLSATTGIGLELGASVVTQVNDLIADAVPYELSTKGTLLLDFLNEAAGSFELPAYFAGLNPAAGACDVTAMETCEFMVHADNFDGTNSCVPQVAFDTTIVGNQLTGYLASAEIAVSLNGVMIALAPEDLSLNGTLAGMPGDWTGFSGTLSGYLPVVQMEGLIDQVPDAALADIGAALGGLPASSVRAVLVAALWNAADASDRILWEVEFTAGDAVVAGCAEHCGTATACDDGHACTTDHCDSLAGCWYEVDDVACDDGNVCTTETCEIGSGCVVVNVADGTACNDGDANTYGDQCVSGQCVGAPSALGCCEAPVLADLAGRDALVLSSFELSDVAGAGQGLDPSVVTGINSLLSGVVLDASKEMGSLLLDFSGETAGSFDLPTYFAVLDPSAGLCDFTAATCDFFVSEDNFDGLPGCGPRYTLSAQFDTATHLVAQTAQYDVVAMYSGVAVVLHLSDVFMEGDVADAGGQHSGFTGTISGTLPIADAMSLVNRLPDSYMDDIASALGLGVTDPNFIRGLLEALLNSQDNGSGGIDVTLNVTMSDANVTGCAGYCVTDAECNDGFACTIDHCDVNAGCWVEAVDAACDDGNACTVDSCSVDSGCVYANVANGTLCDDGLAYTLGDVCTNGYCAGEAENCCDHISITNLAVLVSAEVGNDANAGNGLDLDWNPATCLPAGSCSDGVENEASVIFSALNTLIADVLTPDARGVGGILVDFTAMVADATFQAPIYFGGMDPSQPPCDYLTELCDFLIAEDNFTGQCLPSYAFDNAYYDSATQLLLGGGPGTRFDVLAWYKGTRIELTLYDTQLVVDASGAGMGTLTLPGLLGAALPLTTLHDLLDLVPDADLPAGYTRAFLHTLIDNLPADYATEDGPASSIGLKVELGSANFAGCAQHCLTDSDCDDGISCTVGTCNPTSGCVYTPSDALCDDNNTCTTESCDAALDCQYVNVANGTVCDDNDASTYADKCFGGDCIGAPKGTGCCDEILLGSDSVVLTDLLLSDMGGLGAALGASLVTTVNDLLTDAISWEIQTKGSLLLDFINANAGGNFVLPTYFAAMDPAAGACNPTLQTCDFAIHEDNFIGGVCDPRFSLDASVTGDQLLATSALWEVVVSVDGTTAALDLSNVVVEGTLVAGAAGDFTALTNGTFTADLPVEMLKDAVDLIPADALQDIATSLGVPVSYVSEVLKTFLDGEADGNGQISIVMEITAGDSRIAACSTFCASDASCGTATQCTLPHCDSLAGCWIENVADGTICDDGIAFTNNDVCTAGVCAGVADNCCDHVAWGAALVLSDVETGTAADAFNGLDLDYSLGTCLPHADPPAFTDECSDGVENEVSRISALLNPLIQDVLLDAAVGIGGVLVDLHNYTADGVPFEMPLLYAVVDPDNAGCDYRTQTCQFAVNWDSFTGQCIPAYGFANAKVNAGVLTAGGMDHDWIMDIYYSGTHVVFPVYDVQIKGNVAGPAGAYLGFDGLLGMAITKDTLSYLIGLVPDASFPAGYDRNMIEMWIDMLPSNYPILSDDGAVIEANGISMGFKIHSRGATISGCASGCDNVAQCDDGNPCTDDTCSAAGCTYAFNTLACDDGNALTTGDRCRSGVCEGVLADCDPFADLTEVVGLNAAHVGPDGMTGHGLNVDGYATCQPAGSCENGIDNLLAQLSAVLTDQFVEDYFWPAVTGTGTLLGDFSGLVTDGSEFTLPIYMGVLDPNNAACDLTVQTCEFIVPEFNFDNLCRARIQFENASVVGNHLTAGGPGVDFRVTPSYGGSTLDITFYSVQLDATLTVSGGVTYASGVIGFAVKVATLQSLVDAVTLPAGFPYTKTQVQAIVDAIFSDPDIDTDGDFVKDAVSAGFTFTAVPVSVGDVTTSCATDADCDDLNPCTDDNCVATVGCEYSFNTDPCDDGLADTVNDTCDGGVCLGAYTDCTPFAVYSNTVLMTQAAVRDGAGEADGFDRALDIDGDALTSSPVDFPGPFSDGMNNQASLVSLTVNSILQGMLDDGTIGILGDFRDFAAEGVPFNLYLYQGERAPSDPTCVLSSGNCPMVVGWYNFDDQCDPLYVLDNAIITGNYLTAGGPGYSLQVESSYGGTALAVTAYHVQFDGQVVHGSRVNSFTGLAGLAVRQDDIVDLLALVSDADLAAYGFTRTFVENLITTALEPDVASVIGGPLDAVSITLNVDTRPAIIGGTGVNCATAADCDDGNVCTTDACDGDVGCTHIAITGGGCDDGLAYTINDWCVNGTCTGSVATCDDFVQVTNALRLTTAEIGDDMDPLTTLDVDGLDTTCNPFVDTLGDTNCSISGGADNRVSQVKSLVGTLLQEGIDDGYYHLLLDFSRFTTEGVPFELAALMAGKDPTNLTCDHTDTAVTCDYISSTYNYDNDCMPNFSIDNAVIVGNHLTAGGPGHNIRIPYATGGLYVEVTVYDIQLDATVIHGSPVTLVDGVGAGAIRLADIQNALAEVNFADVVIGGSTYTKDYAIYDLLPALLEPDIDTDDDGVMDAISWGGTFTALPANVTQIGDACNTDAECDDGNPCTIDRCNPDWGCRQTRLTRDAGNPTCSDGNALTTGDRCIDGECLGTLANCEPAVTFEKILRINDAEVPDPMVPAGYGVGVNVDELDSTCSPHLPVECVAINGVDNAIGQISITVNDVLGPEITNNWITVLFDFKDLSFDNAFDLFFYYADKDPAYTSCDPLSGTCHYDPARFNFDDQCNPIFFLDNAMATDLGGNQAHVVAGGPGYRIGTNVKVGTLDTVLYARNVQLDLVVDLSGTDVVSATGVAGFALSVQDIIDLVVAIPTASFPDINGDSVRDDADKNYLLYTLLPAIDYDIDLDGDLIGDAISVSLAVQMGPAVANSSVTCGDGICALSESSCDCPQDCSLPLDWTCTDAQWADGVCDCHCGTLDECDCVLGQCGLPSFCGDGICDATEDCGSCAADCTCGSGDTCFMGSCCTPDCTGNACGHDGCGSLCGWCTGTYEACLNDQCVVALGDCADLFRCVADTGDFDTCYAGAPAHAQSLYVSIMLCVLNRCGLTPTEECTVWALDGACKPAYEACVTNTY